jgi:hypothetical protein
MLTFFGTIALTLIAVSLLAEWERRQHRQQRIQQARKDMMRRQRQYAEWHDPNRPAWSTEAQNEARKFGGGREKN